jgi:hypothetical protein
LSDCKIKSVLSVRVKWFLNVLVALFLLKRKINQKLMRDSLKHLLFPNMVPEAASEFLFRLSFSNIKQLSPVQVSWQAFGKILGLIN